ncbi:MAG: hypothetical protein EPN97_07730 [Alphaproteobacteria bacterium]|nr:MAG: hypothetical protein EPN97_07730 [Alphaproteobacteria bacterium]
MQEILATKTLYDAEFERIRKTFGPMLQYVDGGQPRTILFVDPLKVASAEAYGINPLEFLQYELKQNNMAAAPAMLAKIFNSVSLGSARPVFYAAGTNPMVIPVVGLLRENAADIVIPKTHLTDPRINIPGMTQQQLTSYVNYHEFFHCLHDKYAGAAVQPNVHQKREIFADVGAMMEMIRQGENPNIIDMAIEWRSTGRDADHATLPGLAGLKNYIRRHGVDKIRNMNDRELLDTTYKITDMYASSNVVYSMQEAWAGRPGSPGSADRLESPLKSLPKGWNPTSVLEDKAFELGHKITPKTLMQANNALQAEYAAARDKDPASQKNMWMMILMEDTYVKRVSRTDYDKVNAARGASLTAEDKEDINFVKASKSPLRLAPVYQPKAPGS